LPKSLPRPAGVEPTPFGWRAPRVEHLQARRPAADTSSMNDDEVNAIRRPARHEEPDYMAGWREVTKDEWRRDKRGRIREWPSLPPEEEPRDPQGDDGPDELA
jgi:hypothetical protein